LKWGGRIEATGIVKIRYGRGDLHAAIPAEAIWPCNLAGTRATDCHKITISESKPQAKDNYSLNSMLF